MNINSELPSIALSEVGELVELLGSVQFAPRLATLLGEDSGLHHLSAMRFHRPFASGSVRGVDLLFQHSENALKASVSLALDHYVQDFWLDDPMLRYVKDAHGMQLVLLSTKNISNSRYREFYERRQLAEDCTLLYAAKDYVYALSLFHSENHAPFSLTTLARFRQFSSFLFPMLIQHMRLVPICNGMVSHDGLQELFKRRIAYLRIPLSSREYAACSAALAGQSTQQLADQWSVRPSTVKTYLDRACGKLGIRTRRELLTWAMQKI